MAQSDCVIVDCRFDLDDPDAGFEDYLESHIPGAVYAHLDNDLAGPITCTSGRHPLPDADSFAQFLADSGWTTGKVLVAYDAAGGAIAARLWWLMKYFGHAGAALLDGGIPAWWAGGYDLEHGRPPDRRQPVVPYRVLNDLVRSTAEVARGLDNCSIKLADARSPERYSGEIEPIDAVAGHVPGAVNYPFQLNLRPNGTFKAVETIRGGFQKLIANQQAEDLVHMCGSGVTACHNIFASELAGLPVPGLYVGSWSEWTRDRVRPVEPMGSK